MNYIKSLLFFTLLNINILQAQTIIVSGIHSGEWQADTIRIIDDVIVPTGEVLSVRAGATIIADNYSGIKVYGGFEAIGDADNRITFDVNDTTDFSNYEVIKGAWTGLEFNNCSDRIILRHCDFSHGKTEIDGDGGVMRFYNVDDAEISHCTFSNNIMRRKGGALYAEHSTLNISNTEVFDNKGYNHEGSYQHGGGMAFVNCDVTMDNMHFHDNYCPACYGGGLCFDSCSVVLDKAIIENNYATNAGGIGIQRSAHLDVKLSNMLITHNTVAHYGGGVAIATADPIISNSTIAYNSCIGAGGGGLQTAFGAKPTFVNTIIYGNYWEEQGSSELGSQIFVWGSDCDPRFYNGIIQGGLDLIYNAFNIDKNHFLNIADTDPLFLDTDNNNFMLSKDSPAIDAGNSTDYPMLLPPTDLAGNQRIFNNVIDLGCYEYNNISVNETSYNNGIEISPNPLNANSICTFTLKERSAISLKMTSLDGRIVFNKNYDFSTNGKMSISLDEALQNLSKNNNIYIINIVTDNEILSAKVVY